MAKIVLGMGASHGPLLSTPPEQVGSPRQSGPRKQDPLVSRADLRL